MQDKLQELTDKLYQEGLSKGKHDGEEILKEAHAKAEQIINNAQAEAERIIAQANKDAEDLKQKTEADLKMAATQSISVTRQEIERMVVTKAAEQNVKSILSSQDFVKDLISSIVKAFNPQNSTPVELDLIVPESLKAETEVFVKNEISQLMNTTVNVSYSKKMNGGFKISPKDSGYMLQFTDEEFIQLISNYLRPATRKILFG